MSDERARATVTSVLRGVGVELGGGNRPPEEIVERLLLKLRRPRLRFDLAAALAFLRRLVALQGAPAAVLRDLRALLADYRLDQSPVGELEEVLALLEQVESTDADIFVLPSGGLLAERAVERGYPMIDIPPGYPPRGVLGYSFVSLLCLLRRFYPRVNIEEDRVRTADLLRRLRSSYDSPSRENEAFQLANGLLGRIPILYVPSHIESVAVRWKCQLSENAKVLAFVSVLPEMNHNEICGWENYPDTLKSLHALFLRDAGENPRMDVRMRITRELIEPVSGGVTEVRSRGKSLLERIFSLIYLGDFVTFYLSRLLDTDPVPVSKIDLLKERLSRLPKE